MSHRHLLSYRNIPGIFVYRNVYSKFSSYRASFICGFYGEYTLEALDTFIERFDWFATCLSQMGGEKLPRLTCGANVLLSNRLRTSPTVNEPTQPVESMYDSR